MKKLIPNLLVLLACLSPGAALASHEPDGFPSEEIEKVARQARDYERAMTAYRYFYPTVSMEGMMGGVRAMGIPDNGGLMYMSVKPQHLVFGGNSDTPYAVGNVNLAATGPLVVEVPAGPFLWYVNDHNQEWVADMGQNGPDKGNGGKYLILPHDYTGSVPEGYFVSRASTNWIQIIGRSIPQNDNFDETMKRLTEVKIHPLSDVEHSFAFTNVTDRKDTDMTALKWEDDLEFWRVLHKILLEEPVPSAHEDMYGLLQSLGMEKGKPFAPDDRMTDILARVAHDARDQMLVSAYAGDRPERIVWKDRRWEWVSWRSDGTHFETPSGLDHEARDRWFILGAGASSAKFRRAPGTSSVYWMGLRDKTGAYLDGGKTYRLRVPAGIPSGQFWSATVYDAKTRSQLQNGQARAAVRSLFEKMAPNKDGSVDLYFGPSAPPGKENQWVKTNPGVGWYSIFRIYGPTDNAFNNLWRLDDFVEERRSPEPVVGPVAPEKPAEVTAIAETPDRRGMGERK